jgi:hypothetical protein
VSQPKVPAKPTLPTHPGPEAKLEELREYKAAILRLAQEGNEETVPQLRKLLADPDFVNRYGGNLAATAQKVFAKNIAGDNVLLREAVVRKAELLCDELAGPNPSPIERLLVERVVLCWTYLNYLEIIYAENVELTPEQGLHRQKVLDRVHGRYLSAIRSLADVRRLAIPALQVNIAKRQVNVAGGASS